MPIGPGFQIKNCTQWPLTISLEMIGPLYYGLCQPGEIFTRDTGAVWFTIKAVVSPDNKSHIDDWDCIIPVAAVVGAALVTALTAGAGTYVALTAAADAAGIAEVGGSSFFLEGLGSATEATAAASLEGGLQAAETTRLTATVGDALLAVPSAQAPVGALLNGVLPSLSNIVVEDALAAGGQATITAATAVKVLGAIFSKNGGASRAGCYAGPPWPFRQEMKPYSIVGGPQAEGTSDRRLLLSEGTQLEIVEGFVPPRTDFKRPVLGKWTKMPDMPGGAVSMAMFRHGLMFGVNREGNVYSWDGNSWNMFFPSPSSDNSWREAYSYAEIQHKFVHISAADDMIKLNSCMQ